jgi:hypothetical protein
MRDNTYMSQVEVDILLHSVLVVDSCGIPLVLCLFLFLHLYIQLDLLMVHWTGVPSYTAWGYNVVVRYCTAVAQCNIVAMQFYTIVVQCYTRLVLG